MIDTMVQASARELAKPLPLLLPQDVRGMRRVAGLSMRELARRLGVSVVAVSRWEAGADVPTRANVGRILDELMAAQREAGEIRATVRRIRRRSG
jgi:DNA-binding transcriptional regulator YiaG